MRVIREIGKQSLVLLNEFDDEKTGKSKIARNTVGNIKNGVNDENIYEFSQIFSSLSNSISAGFQIRTDEYLTEEE